MKIYNTTLQGYLLLTYGETFDEEGNVISTSNQTIPEGHRFYTQALMEVEEGEAQILPYAEL